MPKLTAPVANDFDHFVVYILTVMLPIGPKLCVSVRERVQGIYADSPTQHAVQIFFYIASLLGKNHRENN